VSGWGFCVIVGKSIAVAAAFCTAVPPLGVARFAAALR
jgi:hypothetical protein